MAIQLDMFEVQLGAALLLQFEDTSGSKVTVVADAGIKAGAAYPQDHVAKKLHAILGTGSTIDLLIGTHYDQDHLAGLIDVVKHPGFTIREALLPPIRKPKHGRPGGSAASEELPARLVDLTDAEWNGHIQDLEELAMQAQAQLEVLGAYEPDDDDGEEFVDPSEDFDYEVTDPTVPAAANSALAIIRLTRIRASAVKGAIVATWLRQLVRELQRKNIPIRTLDITAGCPEYFEWDGSGSFAPCSATVYAASKEPKFTLLGPSRQLIARHSNKLPIGCYLAVAGKIPLMSVSASNQLSYVLLFEAEGQSLLVCGDAGCVDFWDKSAGSYHAALLTAVKAPHVVQVAHHAGANYRFYDALLKSPYGSISRTNSFLLLSHATRDALRPSAAFNQFVADLKATPRPFEILTTSQPDPAKVSSFRADYAPPTTPAPTSTGDVRLEYSGFSWAVKDHAVKV